GGSRTRPAAAVFGSSPGPSGGAASTRGLRTPATPPPSYAPPLPTNAPRADQRGHRSSLRSPQWSARAAATAATIKSGECLSLLPLLHGATPLAGVGAAGGGVPPRRDKPGGSPHPLHLHAARSRLPRPREVEVEVRHAPRQAVRRHRRPGP